MLSWKEQQTLETYNKIAAGWAEKRNPNFWRSEFKLFGSLLPTGKIIDIGCGSGKDAALFVQGGYTYTGIDFSEEMLMIAMKKMPLTKFLLMSMYSLEFPPCSFDGFWASASLLHIPKENIATVLHQIRKVVRPGGIGFFSLKKGVGEQIVQGSSHEDKRFFAFYERQEFIDVLTKNGFEIIAHGEKQEPPDPIKNPNPDIWLSYFVRRL